MYLTLECRLREALIQHLKASYDIDPGTIVIEQPPRSELGDFAVTVAFGLAKNLRRPPRKIAEELAAHLPLPPGITRVEVAGAGYLNFFAERRTLFEALAAATVDRGGDHFSGKVIVEHTNINPNKAAHVGHLRNAVLGDTFVRLLRSRGEAVEVQNYIDNTGVQVADVVVAFQHLEKKTPQEVQGEIDTARSTRTSLVEEGALSPDPHNFPLVPSAPTRDAFSFDYRCWDAYAAISRHYQDHSECATWRSTTLKEIEEGENATARLAETVATAIVHSHLRTMARLNVVYDLLPRESEILRLHFWQTAFEQLKQRGAVRLETRGKNAGCWVMDRPDGDSAAGNGAHSSDEENEPDRAKVIVRSDGTVTYVGKDIAYQLWKFGLLGRDFGYQPFELDGAAGQQTPTSVHTVWVSSTLPSPQAPKFGHGALVFNVIDVRQSYLQEVVTSGLRALGYEAQAKNSVHFSYEMVTLTPRCAEELGYSLTPEERQKSSIEVSGRRGLGVKADDLIDRLTRRALDEVRARHSDLSLLQQFDLALPIAVGALRFFLLKFTKTSIIAFDFQEALSFDGETGPYVQYAAVRAANILRRHAAQHSARVVEPSVEDVGRFLVDTEIWDLVVLASQTEWMVQQAINTTEPSCFARYAFQLAQAFSNFYHHYPVLQEPDDAKRAFLLTLVAAVHRQLAAALDLMGIEVPAAM